MIGYQTFCRDVSLQPPGVSVRTLTLLAVHFNPRDFVSCEIGSAFGLRAGLLRRKMFKAGDKKSKSFQVCCPSWMQFASDFFSEVRNRQLKLGAASSLSHSTPKVT